MNTYARLPVAFSHGEGAWLWDTEGKRYLDALSGIAVNTLGHAHPRFTAALNEQIGRLIHCSNIYQLPRNRQPLKNNTADTPPLAKSGAYIEPNCPAKQTSRHCCRLVGVNQNEAAFMPSP